MRTYRMLSVWPPVLIVEADIDSYIIVHFWDTILPFLCVLLLQMFLVVVEDKYFRLT